MDRNHAVRRSLIEGLVIRIIAIARMIFDANATL